MPIAHMSLNAVSVTSTKTALLAANIKRRSVVLGNCSSTVTVYLKADSSATVLTASNGIPLFPNAVLTFNCDPNLWRDPIEGITASGTADVRVMEVE